MEMLMNRMLIVRELPSVNQNFHEGAFVSQNTPRIAASPHRTKFYWCRFSGNKI